MIKYDKNAVIPFEKWLEWNLTSDDSLIDWKVYSRKGLPPCHRNYPLSKPIYEEYLLQIFEQPNLFLLGKFTIDQVGDLLLNSSRASFREPLDCRRWNAIQILFDQVFSPLVSESLGHKSEINLATKKLDMACYLWWDLRTYQPHRGSRVNDERFITFCERCLQSDKVAIQESALHGLGHSLQGKYGFPEARSLLQDFISRGEMARLELIRYAQIAMTGEML